MTGLTITKCQRLVSDLQMRECYTDPRSVAAQLNRDDLGRRRTATRYERQENGDWLVITEATDG